MGSKSSSSKSATSNTQQDQRVVTGQGSIGVGAYGNLTTSTSSADDNSISVDSRAWTDASIRDAGNSTTSTSTTVNYSGTDGATAAEIARSNTDAVRAVTQMGTQGFDRLGGAFTDLYETAGSNLARAWEHTLDASAEMMSESARISGAGAASATTLAGQAVAAFKPGESGISDALKWGAVAAVVVVGLHALK